MLKTTLSLKRRKKTMKMLQSKLHKTYLWKGVAYENRELLLDPYYLYDENIGANDMENSSGDYIPVKGNRIHFMPDCTVPRIKVKGYCDEHGVSVCKHIKDADVIFYGPDSINNLFVYSRNSYYPIPVTTFKKFLQMIYSVGEIAQLRVQSKLSQIECDFILCELDMLYYLCGEKTLPWGRFAIALITDAEYNEIDALDHRQLKGEEEYETLKKILDPTSKYVHQDNILKHLNSVPMTEEMYESLGTMFQSSDVENHITAMEIMANCDYGPSAIYILLLMKKYGTQIYNSKTRRHVNFQSLLNYFSIQPHQLNKFSLDDILIKLNSLNLLTKSTVDKLMPLANKEFTVEIDSEVFEISGIKLKEQYQQLVIDDGIIEEEAGSEIEIAVDNLVPAEQDQNFDMK